MSDMTLVTGVTGNVGKEVINQLIRKGLPVKAAALNLAKQETLFIYNHKEDKK